MYHCINAQWVQVQIMLLKLQVRGAIFTSSLECSQNTTRRFLQNEFLLVQLFYYICLPHNQICVTYFVCQMSCGETIVSKKETWCLHG